MLWRRSCFVLVTKAVLKVKFWKSQVSSSDHDQVSSFISSHVILVKWKLSLSEKHKRKKTEQRWMQRERETENLSVCSNQQNTHTQLFTQTHTNNYKVQV